MYKSRSESELESNLIFQMAQLEEDESLNDILDSLPEEEGSKDKIDPSLNPESEENLPDMDADMEEAQAVKDLIPWDSFVIIFDPHYSQLLTDTLSLPEPKAKAKSFYIYFSPENKRLEGILNKRYIGGYDEKEKLGDDFEFIKSLSPEGFPAEWKKKILTDIDESPAVENQDIKEELEKKEPEEEETVEETDVEETDVEETDVEETEAKKKQSKEMPPPAPVGKVDTINMASNDRNKHLLLRRFSRLKEINNL